MIIVTGANGFIGKNLVAKLLQLGKEVLPLDVDNKYAFPDFDEVEYVFHMGAISSTTETNLDLIYENNIQYSVGLFEKCIEYGIPVSYASSASVYGNTNDHTVSPLNYYAMSKATIDLWVETNMSRFSSVHGYRFYNVYGAGEEHKGGQASPVYQFINQAVTNKCIKIFNREGDGCRDFVWVGDVCDTMLTENRSSGIYDIGTGNSYHFSEIADCVAKHFDVKIEVIPFPEHLKGKYQFNTQAKESHVLPDFLDVMEYIKRTASLIQ